jgi:asparagine synthase (glutamine-hydrolysing)
MCGIFGSTIKGIDCKKAVACLAHRGPDDFGIYSDENGISLCQTRLAIIDLSPGGHQPMWNGDNSIGIIFNGEIYNYQELKKDLEEQGVQFVSKSDTEVILKAYEKFGAEYFSKLRGMWALVIYDKKKNTLVFSRDYFGIKPLLLSETSEGLLFGSEARTILQNLKSVTPNTDKYYLYYNFGFFPGKDTAYKEIRKVLPGEVLTYDLEKKVFSSTHLSLKNSNEKVLEESSAVNVVDKGLRDTIEKHFIADVPVGVLLSGGNDSSLIASISKSLGKQPLCFNIAIEGSKDSEYAEKVAKYLDLPFESLKVSSEVFKDQYQKILNHLDEPTADVSYIPTSLVFSMIKGKSKVVLSGEGGDELFGGYGRHGRLYDIKEFKEQGFIIDKFLYAKNSLNFLNPLLARIRQKLLGSSQVALRYLLLGRNIDLNIKEEDTVKYLEHYYNSHWYHKLIPANLFFDLFFYLPGNLMQKADICSMFSSIESRVPFLDKEFFKVSSSLDNKFRLSSEYREKKILKKVMEKYLPKELIYRPKQGFGIKIGKFGNFVLEDLEKAILYHKQNAKVLGIIDSGLEGVVEVKNAKVILDKFPRFAYALITNHQVMQKYLK